ncbi:MAG: hypothetical protein N2440_04150 [Actinobacteria bacterium]|nr:hypothetical protein [Actinomycetota bacterium]
MDELRNDNGPDLKIDEELASYVEETEKKQHDESVSRERILEYLRIALLICTLLFVVSLFLEIWGSYRISNELARASAVTRRTQRTEPKIKTSNLKRYFPLRIIGYHTKGIKDIIGQDRPKAEAVYEPEDMNLQLRSPIVIYCQVVYFSNLSDAELFIQEKLKDFPKDQQAIVLENYYFNSGYSKDEGAYFLATIHKGLVFWFKTSYIEIIPNEENRLRLLKNHNEKVASEVIKFIGQAEAGVEQIESN